MAGTALFYLKISPGIIVLSKPGLPPQAAEGV